MTSLSVDLNEAFFLSISALACYDYVLTIPEELELVWRSKKWTGATWLFLVNRYFLLCRVASQVAITMHPSHGFLIGLNITPTTILNIIAVVFSALRTYAVGASARKTAAFVLVLGLVLVVLNTYSSADIMIYAFPCGENSRFLDTDSLTNPQDPASSSDTRVSLVADTFHMISPAVASVREARRLGIRSPLIWIIFRDGSVYFIILTLLNLVQTWDLFHIQPKDYLGLFASYPCGSFPSLLQPILISRFILNLRHGANSGTGAVSTTVGYDCTADVVFALEPGSDAPRLNNSILLEGLDGPLSHGFEEEEDELETGST